MFEDRGAFDRSSYGGHTPLVKASVTIPNAILKAADELAHRIGISRSRLCTLALESIVQEHDDEAITAKINEVYANESSSLDPVLESIQYPSIEKNKWQREFSRNT